MNDGERAPMDVHDLFVALDRFVSDNRSHSFVERRWLALVANQVRNIALGLKTCGVGTLSDYDQRRIREFRLGEIEAAKAELVARHAEIEEESAKLEMERESILSVSGKAQ